MKILHTSDWHIGKQLQKINFEEDLKMFFNWLIKTIEEHKIDILLISGDIFDQANPSQSAFNIYYDMLSRLEKLDCKTVITGGNHDSGAVLEAPKELLKSRGIEVVGSSPQEISKLFFPFEKDGMKVVIAAVPFLKDRDIRKAAAGESYSDKIQQIKEGLKLYFKDINQYSKDNYSDYKLIVMGHLYVQGSKVSESEREIQIGNQAGVESEIFEGIPDYVALGHIHKPQTISKSNSIYYCGSPVSFSFSEKEDEKQINIIEFTSESMNVEFIKIPKRRSLVSFNGTLNEIKKQLENYTHKNSLQSLASIEVLEDKESITIRQELEDLLQNQTNNKILVIKPRLIFKDKIRGATEVFTVGTDVSDVTPIQMFEKKLELETDLENKDDLINAFKEILEDLKI
ncbi:MAG: exonuclease sbcCD subunit D [Crocinitomicaceae bacterium]|nr:exonuclease sbcCD subunit D [Crocinitomicaceae bacterium]